MTTMSNTKATKNKQKQIIKERKKNDLCGVQMFSHE